MHTPQPASTPSASAWSIAQHGNWLARRPGMDTLVLSHVDMNTLPDDAFDVWQNVCAHHHGLRHVRLDSCQLGHHPQRWAAMCDALARHRHVQSLTLRHNDLHRLPNQAWKHLLKVMHQNPQLTLLDLAGNQTEQLDEVVHQRLADQSLHHPNPLTVRLARRPLPVVLSTTWAILCEHALHVRVFGLERPLPHASLRRRFRHDVRACRQALEHRLRAERAVVAHPIPDPARIAALEAMLTTLDAHRVHCAKHQEDAPATYLVCQRLLNRLHHALGHLCVTQGDVERALHAWSSIDQSDDTHYASYADDVFFSLYHVLLLKEQSPNAAFWHAVPYLLDAQGRWLLRSAQAVAWFDDTLLKACELPHDEEIRWLTDTQRRDYLKVALLRHLCLYHHTTFQQLDPDMFRTYRHKLLTSRSTVLMGRHPYTVRPLFDTLADGLNRAIRERPHDHTSLALSTWQWIVQTIERFHTGWDTRTTDHGGASGTSPLAPEASAA